MKKRRCENCMHCADDDCFNEDITEDEFDRVRNGGGNNCNGFLSMKDRLKEAETNINDWVSQFKS